MRALGATCHTPVGVLALDGRVRGFVGLPDGSAWLVEEARDRATELRRAGCSPRARPSCCEALTP